MAIIQTAVAGGSPDSTRFAMAEFEGVRGTRTIEELAEESRKRYPEPIRGVPLGVDIIRADRDSR